MPSERGPERQAGFLEAMRAFARESAFMDFFREEAPRYEAWGQSMAAQARTSDYRSAIEEYSGMKVRAGHRVLLSPLLLPDRGGRLNHVDRDRPGGARIYSTVGPAGFSRGEPRFRYADMAWDAWHEMAHVLLDPRLEGRRRWLRRTRRLADPEGLGRYGSWVQCVRENLAQGLASRLVAWSRETGRLKAPGRGAPHESLRYLGSVAGVLKKIEGRTGRDGLDRWLDRILAAIELGTAPPASSRAGAPASPKGSGRRERRDGLF